MQLQFVIASKVRERANASGKQCTEEFLLALDDLVRRSVDRSAAFHNGGHTRLSAAVLGHVSGAVFKK